MNKRQKEIIERQLNSEEDVLNELKKVYQQALTDCANKIRELSSRTDMENAQSIIYQRRYQEALKAQLEAILDKLQNDSYTGISDYLTRCYKDGYLGVMYDLHGQGIPIVMPIDQAAVVRAVQTNSKLSRTLYESIGEDVDVLAKSVRSEISRGIAAGMTWNQTAANWQEHSRQPHTIKRTTTQGESSERKVIEYRTSRRWMPCMKPGVKEQI